jgi:hypothetical protein
MAGLTSFNASVINAAPSNDYFVPAKADLKSGFTNPFSGFLPYERFAPKQANRDVQINEPLGEVRADEIAVQLGMDKSKCFTQQQFFQFVTGRGVGGNLTNSFLVDECVILLTNTKDNPLIRPVNGQLHDVVLGSYGLTINANGMLESLANSNCPCRIVNELLGPGGYIETWCNNNGASDSLKMLRKSAYSVQVPYGSQSQNLTDPYELVTNTIGNNTCVVGMSMIPPIWEVNFCLIYMLNPALAANMPAYWAPIPKNVVSAINASTNGQIPIDKYANEF